MAVITVKLGGPRPVETKRRLIQELTERAADALAIAPGDVIVLIEELGLENYASGGRLQSDRGDGEAITASRQAIEAFFRKPVKEKQKKAVAKSPRRR
jgi:4-oxalocrotonate tautomerase family enzyme